MIDTEEFVAAFNVYVRETDGGITDTREDTARQWAEVDFPPSELEAGDVAAIFSGCVCPTDPLRVMEISMLENGRLASYLREMYRKGILPLTIKPDHPAEAFFARLLETEEGCALYQRIAIYLNYGASTPKIKPFMYGYKKEG